MTFSGFLLQEMSDETALIAAIFARPLDQLPKLVYADWLAEHDDSFEDVVRFAVAAAVPPPAHAFIGDHGEDFNVYAYRWVQENASEILSYQNGEFGYTLDGVQYVVQVSPVGQVMRQSMKTGVWESVSVAELGAVQATRTALLMLLGHMVDAHRENRFVPGYDRPGKRQHISADLHATWADHAAFRAERTLEWLVNRLDRENNRDPGFGRDFCRFVARTLEPLAAFVAGGSFRGDSTEFTRQVARVETLLDRYRGELGGSVSDDCRARFVKASQEIVAAMMRHRR